MRISTRPSSAGSRRTVNCSVPAGPPASDTSTGAICGYREADAEAGSVAEACVTSCALSATGGIAMAPIAAVDPASSPVIGETRSDDTTARPAGGSAVALPPAPGEASGARSVCCAPVASKAGGRCGTKAPDAPPSGGTRDSSDTGNGRGCTPLEASAPPIVPPLSDEDISGTARTRADLEASGSADWEDGQSPAVA